MQNNFLSPGLCIHPQVVMDKVAALRESLKPIAEAQGLKFSYMPIMIKVITNFPLSVCGSASLPTNRSHSLALFVYIHITGRLSVSPAVPHPQRQSLPLRGGSDLPPGP